MIASIAVARAAHGAEGVGPKPEPRPTKADQWKAKRRQRARSRKLCSKILVVIDPPRHPRRRKRESNPKLTFNASNELRATPKGSAREKPAPDVSLAF
jgi:hypothetical protein